MRLAATIVFCSSLAAQTPDQVQEHRRFPAGRGLKPLVGVAGEIGIVRRDGQERRAPARRLAHLHSENGEAELPVESDREALVALVRRLGVRKTGVISESVLEGSQRSSSR